MKTFIKSYTQKEITKFSSFNTLNALQIHINPLLKYTLLSKRFHKNSNLNTNKKKLTSKEGSFYKYSSRQIFRQTNKLLAAKDYYSKLF